MANVRSVHLSLMRSQISSALRLLSVLKECLRVFARPADVEEAVQEQGVRAL